MQQQTKSPLPEGIPTVPQKFSNDLPDFDLFFFVLYSYFSSSYFTCLFPNFSLIQKRLNSSRILQTWVTFPDSSLLFIVKSILCQLPSHIRYSVGFCHNKTLSMFPSCFSHASRKAITASFPEHHSAYSYPAVSRYVHSCLYFWPAVHLLQKHWQSWQQ